MDNIWRVGDRGVLEVVGLLTVLFLKQSPSRSLHSVDGTFDNLDLRIDDDCFT